MRWFKRLQFNSKNPEDREQALETLSHSVGGKEIRLFAQGLLDEELAVRRAATKAIAAISPKATPKCIETLLPLLKDEDFVLRKSVALALKQLGWEPVTPEERAFNHIALGSFDNIDTETEAVEPLLSALKTGPFATRLGVVLALEKLQNHIQDPRIIGPLIDALRDSEPGVRCATANAMGVSTDERRISPLLKAFKDDVPVVRASAAEAVGKTGKADYLPHFLPLLKDTNFEVRIATIKALGKMKSSDALDPIISMLKDSDTDVRKTAVESLAKLCDPRSVSALIAALIDPESVVRHAVANTLQVINCEWQISEEAQKAIPSLEEGLTSDEYWVREAAGKALHRIRNL